MGLLDGLFSPDDQLGLLADLLKRQQPGYVPPGMIQGVQIQPQPQQQALPVSPEIQGNAPTPPPMQPQMPREVPPPNDAILPEDVPPPAPGVGLIDPNTMALPTKNQGLLGDFQGKWGKEIDQFTPSTATPFVSATPSEPISMQAPTRVMPVLPEKKGAVSKWMESDTMPLSLALMQAGAGLLTPTHGKSFTAGLAQGLGGFSQGLLSGAQMQGLNRKKEMEAIKLQNQALLLQQKLGGEEPKKVMIDGEPFLTYKNTIKSLTKDEYKHGKAVQTVDGNGNVTWEVLKPGEKKAAFVKPERLTNQERFIQEKVDAGMSRDEATKMYYSLTHAPDSGKSRGAKWFTSPETGEFKSFAYGESPPPGWKPVYAEKPMDVPKWAIDQSTNSLKNTYEFKTASPQEQEIMLMQRAQSLMGQKEQLRGGGKVQKTKEESNKQLGEMPPAEQYPNRKITDTVTKKRYQSINGQWQEIQ